MRNIGERSRHTRRRRRTRRSGIGCTHSHGPTRLYLGRGDRATGFALTKAEEFASLADLKAYACGSHDEIDRFLAAVTEARLEARISMPWFTDPPLSITVTEALTQCAMHSTITAGRTPPGCASSRARRLSRI